MTKRLAVLLAILLALAPTLAHAFALNGPLFTSAIPDQARYKPGELVTIPLVLTNNTGAAIGSGGAVSCQMSGRGQTVNDPSVATLPALGVGASATVEVIFQLSTYFDYRGYLVACTARAAGGAVLDTATAAVDVSSDWSQFARECMVTHHGIAGYDAAAGVRGLRAYGCSVFQFYDVYWKIARPYSPNPTWPSLNGTVMSGQALRGYVAEANRSRAASLFFLDWAAAGGGFQTDGTGVSLSWGLFRPNCSPNCTAAGLAQVPLPSTWNETSLVEVDPTNTTWQAYWIATTKPMIDHYGFSGCQVDTLGDINAAYTRSGSAIDFTHAASGFLNNTLAKACRRGTFNNVSLNMAQDTLQKGTEDFFYAERHPAYGDGATYASIHDSTGVLRSYNGLRAINYALYMNECLASDSADGIACTNAASTAHCSTRGGPDTCTFNEPGLRFSHAVVLASGAWNNNVVDGVAATPDDPQFISNIYVPGSQFQLAALPSTKQALHDYATWAVANEKILRHAPDVDATLPTSVTSGACASDTSGAAGKVYMIDKAGSGLQFAAFVNLCNQTSLDPQDRYGLAVTPTTYASVGFKMYYAGGATGVGAGTVGGANKLWFSSPDVNHGVAQAIAYSKGSDGGGTFVTGALPSLQYLSALWLETDALAAGDYAYP